MYAGRHTDIYIYVSVNIRRDKAHNVGRNIVLSLLDTYISLNGVYSSGPLSNVKGPHTEDSTHFLNLVDYMTR